MNILNLLIKEKRVAGVEISDQVVRIAYFRPRRKSNDDSTTKSTKNLPERELVLIEEPIAANLIIDGAVTDIELLGKTIKEIWTKSGITPNYAVVSIPENKIFSRIFPFPKMVNEGALEEAVNLAIDFQIPLKKTESYVGWEDTVESHSTHEVLISAIPKSVAHGYIETLDYAGIKIVALESHLSSIARSIAAEPGVTTLFTKNNPDGEVTIFILRDGALRFSRTVPSSLTKEGNLLTAEVEHVKSAFESDKKVSIAIAALKDAPYKPEYLKYPELSGYTSELRSKWLVAVGAVGRGEIPEGQDAHISLLPVGTAEAYAFQKTATFIALMRNMIIGVSLFFLFAFLTTYFFVFYLSQAATNANSGILAHPISPDVLKSEARIKNINSLTAASQAILSTTPTWNTFLDEVNTHVIPGVLVSNFSVASVSDPVLMVGVAKDRNTLNLFKKSLQSSDYITAVDLPITNIEKKADIPFTLSFKIKDPNMLYNK